jgi:C-terminal processing protease CtpA/Prc
MSNRRGPRFRSVARVLVALVLGLVVLPVAREASAQGYDRIAKARAKKMLEEIATAVEKRYYDEKYRGVDLKAHFAKAQLKLDDATSLNHAFRIIAQALLEFDDSHTYFVPPGLNVTVDYGWRMKMVANDCLVTAVRPGSDAEAKGLRPGDKLSTLEGYKPTRTDLWKLHYLFSWLSPMRAMAVEAQSPGGQPRRLEIASKLTERRRVVDVTGEDGGFDIQSLVRDADDAAAEHVFTTVGDATVWKMPSFDISRDDVDTLVRRVKSNAPLILDLRGNGGGYVAALEELTSRFFDREVKIADLKGRKPMKPMTAKKRGSASVAAKVVVLIDSNSASAAELFARVMQLEKRAVVIGDKSAGAVMQAETFSGELGVERVVLYGASIATADVLMADGTSLERNGVIPDELILPTPEDLAARRDPVLARAAAIVGASLTPEAAGQMFPIKWR